MSQRHHRSRRPSCSQDNCGSRRFHIGDDGFTYCDQGHQQDAGLVVSQDTGELIVEGRRTRRADSDAESGVTRVSGFTGTKAFEHYLLCIQLILRKQLRWLIDIQKLPEELETIVRDLFALRLQKLQHKVSYDGDTDTEAQSSRMFSSQSEGDSGTDAETVTSHRSTALRKQPQNPKLTELLSLIYVGILLLRIPITIADMHKWVNDGDLLYYRAAREVPLSMRDRLPGHLQEPLEPQDLLRVETLHRKVLDILTSLNADVGMQAPPLNHPLVLYRWVRALCLPLEVYVIAQRVGQQLDFDYQYTVDAKAWSSISLRCPEVRLMTLVVIATKLLFPFDDAKRYPKSSRDMTALKMDWEVWQQVQSRGNMSIDDNSAVRHVVSQDESSHLTYQNAFTMTEEQSLELADDRLDQYLDWYEGNIASEEVRERGRAGREAEFRRTLFRMFPMHNVESHDKTSSPRAKAKIGESGNTSAEKLIQVQAALRPQRIVTVEESDDVPRTGTSYHQYRAVEELNGATQAFHEKAAQLAGYPLKGMLKAVFAIERRLLQFEKDLRKQDQPEES
ncbi:Putative transcription initiation factor Rrn7, Zinc-finger [Septoria linicola]|uniref:Transcription initiation factor Rrn7, Zinc-finger n=1 Tax=Septoria linicola TaxID=215465 RepID=A0A9Q9AJ31_9PEZI|nr:putative transcription initiation factor Rrn7, Zinc-finger [Septoria linicola]USW49970.1 Putative transcription initiation factor Rrn7, Zinc-finger [Septoria linicola]